MTSLGTWLVGLTAYPPAELLVWWSGRPALVAMAILLLISAAALVFDREHASTRSSPEHKSPNAGSGDHPLLNAA